MQTKHFGKQDKMISCSCCGEGDFSAGMYVLLEIIRVHFDSPVKILSGARCKKHHKAIYENLETDAPPYSDHLIDSRKQSSGADIEVKGHTPFEVYNFLNNCPFSDVISLGIYDWGVHVGLRGYPARW